MKLVHSLVPMLQLHGSKFKEDFWKYIIFQQILTDFSCYKIHHKLFVMISLSQKDSNKSKLGVLCVTNPVTRIFMILTMSQTETALIQNHRFVDYKYLLKQFLEMPNHIIFRVSL